jgi:hypothetical protein
VPLVVMSAQAESGVPSEGAFSVTLTADDALVAFVVLPM